MMWLIAAVVLIGFFFFMGWMSQRNQARLNAMTEEERCEEWGNEQW